MVLRIKRERTIHKVKAMRRNFFIGWLDINFLVMSINHKVMLDKHLSVASVLPGAEQSRCVNPQG